MIPLKRLYVLAGFNDADIAQKAGNLQRRFEAGSVRFLARPYPAKPESRQNYLKMLVQAANDVIFNSTTATNFCRKQDQPCAAEVDRKKVGKNSCDQSYAAEAACARARPHLIVVICADQVFDEVFSKLGRGVLILRLAGPTLSALDVVKSSIDSFEPVAANIVLAVTNRSKSLYAPLVPDLNFQRLGNHPIARDIQANPAEFASILQKYHANLYKGDFKNPRKPQVRGGYMLDPNTAFQQDRLHSTVQIIGDESRRDGFHLINAYHTYGVKTDPGFHFDVMNAEGHAIRHNLTDILTKRVAGGGEATHLNATPCDRLL